ncbi:MAG: hypothetical protein RLZZ450_4864 [Pseudomonadota bacterium]
MSSSSERAYWRPTELVVQALHQSMDSFVGSLPSAYLLVILLDSADSELGTGLLDQEAAAAVMEGQVLRTAVSHPPEDAFLPATPRARASLGAPTSASAANAAADSPVDRIPPELRTRFCHIVPIHKRDSSSFLQHVSVGRARNHDVVLRHDTVSKFHAWFELGVETGLMVKDMGSTNHTYVDGSRIEKRTKVEPGQTVRFGSVEAYVTTPATLWRSVRR